MGTIHLTKSVARLIALLSISVVAFATLPPAQAAGAKIGGTCKPVGAKATVSGKALICTKVGSKSIWQVKTTVKAGAVCKPAGAKATVSGKALVCTKVGSKLIWKVTTAIKAVVMKGVIKIFSATDLSGAGAFCGTDQLDGARLAIQQVNDQKFLGGATLTIDSSDTATNPQTAASLATKAVANSSMSVILGACVGSEAAAMAPIVQQGGMPLVMTQSGGPGVLIGDYIYRVTAPQTSYFYKGLAYMQSQGVKKYSVIYNSANGTTTQLATQIIPDNASKYGYTVGSTSAVGYTTVDYSGVISKVLGDKPDAVAVLVVGAANPTVVTQLRQAGFTGPILGQQGDDAGTLKPAGAAAKGVVWTSDFTSWSAATPTAAAFVLAYRSAYSADPTSFSAEGYDAAWMIARAIKAAGSGNRQAIKNGLATVAATGFDGAEGRLKFSGNELVLPGVLVGWNGTKEFAVK